MAEEKKTQLGTLNPQGRLTGATAAVATPAPTPPPGGGAHATSYLPPMAPQEDPLLGQLVAGRYLVSKKLGEGGMGAVYLATHTLLEKQVALKVLHQEFSRKADLVERFIQEAKAASRIRHENVIDISDFGSTPEGQVFFAMELLKGHDLHEEVARARLAGELLPWSRSKKIFLQICAALQAAHDKGIIHRDLKPENIYLVDFLGEPDFVKLLDFGIAKLTEVNEGDRKLTKTGMLFGTPEYMSPEQARGETVDHRVDIYAMGCILFQLLTGRVPFEAENFMGVLSLHLTEQPPQVAYETLDRIGAPHALVEIIDRALVKDRNQRWSTIAEFANAIRIACGDPLPTAGGSMVMPSVQAPSSTTTRPQTAQVAAMGTPITHSGATTQNRNRTQWTGNVSVPEEDAAKKQTGSKLPLIIGAVVLLGGGAATAFFLMNRGKDPAIVDVGSGSGSAIASITPDAGAAIAPTPDAVVDTTPKTSEIHIDSNPRGADIFEEGATKAAGKTPFGFAIPQSATVRKFTLKKKGYSDLVLEVIPDRPKLEYVEDLVRGKEGTTVVKKDPHSGSGSAATVPGVGSAVVKPETGSGSSMTVKPPGDGSAKPPGDGSATKPPGDGSAKPPGDDCPPEEFPCLKKMPGDTPKQ